MVESKNSTSGNHDIFLSVTTTPRIRGNKFMNSIRTRILVALVLPVIMFASALLLALSLPQSDGHFYVQQGYLVADLPGQTPGLRVFSFSAAGELIPALPEFVMEEPDVLPSHAQV